MQLFQTIFYKYRALSVGRPATREKELFRDFKQRQKTILPNCMNIKKN